MPKASLHELSHTWFHKSLLCALVGLFLCPPSVLADTQTKYATEERFHELFVTAGYSTAFGAALGAAALGLSDNPAEKLQYVAMGASMGFIFGSMVGTYVIFTPIFSYGGGTRYGATSPKFKSLEAQWLVAEF